MSTLYRFTLPVAETHRKFPATGEVCFAWDYDARADELMRLYPKGKQEQWDAESRIDWNLPVDPEDPMQMDEQVIPLWNTPIWAKLSERQRAELRNHSQVFNPSQFLHGEQGALVCSARIVPTVRDIGLWSERVQKTYAEAGGIQYAAIDAQPMLDNDARVAEEFDRRMKEGFGARPS
jgi:hypothetical protein